MHVCRTGKDIHMSAERAALLQTLFQQAVGLSAEQRARFIVEACGQDESMRCELELLLRHDEAAPGDYLDGSSSIASGDTLADTVGAAARIGEHVGPYSLLSILGEGGMGAVYEAEQERPRRRVALKLIRAGLMTDAMLRRFDFEAEVLGRLEHPGIARIFEAGIASTAMGRQPYFAMELVRGTPLDEWAREHKSPLKRRLQLLIEVCQAVHHAHTKGIIHRDLKPPNILIGDDERPKILDFGVARATDADVRSTMLHTQSGQIVGTLPYMAPEQAAGRIRELDTSSDVYALGVIAYELLSGQMPYSLENMALHEQVRVICEQEPSRLSRIDRSLRGDVETIVQKALEKDRTRRYHTAGELAGDLKRYLEYEPITARPPSTWYQLAKFTRRNKLLVSAAAGIMLVLAAGVIVSTIFAIRAERQKRQAIDNRAEAEATVAFLTQDVLSGATPQRMPDKTVRDAIVKVMLDPAADAIAHRFQDRPTVEAAIRTTLATCYIQLGRSDRALPHAQAALETCRRVLPDDDPRTLRTLALNAAILQNLERLDEAEGLFREALARSRRVLGEDNPDTLYAMGQLGYALWALGNVGESESVCREAMDRYLKVLGPDDPRTLRAICNMVLPLRLLGRYPEAEKYCRDAMDGFRRRNHGEDDDDSLAAMNNLAALMEEQGKHADAEKLCREVLALRIVRLGENHPDTLMTMNNLGHQLQETGRNDLAEPLLVKALDGCRKSLPAGHYTTRLALTNLARVRLVQHRLPDAESLCRENLGLCLTVLHPNHHETLRSMHNLGFILGQMGKYAEAESLLGQAAKQREVVRGPDHPDTLGSIGDLAGVLAVQGKLEQATPLYATLYHRCATAKLSPAEAAVLMSYYGPALVRMKQYAEADEPLREAARRLRDTGQASSPEMTAVVTALAEIFDHLGRPEEAKKWRAELSALKAATRASTAPSAIPATRPVISALAEVYENTVNPEETARYRAMLSTTRVTTLPTDPAPSSATRPTP
jgi:non-specific serine/threonine protein kinase/serine/threonine-protein kinase